MARLSNRPAAALTNASAFSPSAYIRAASITSSRSDDRANPTLTVCMPSIFHEYSAANAIGDISGPIAAATAADGR